MGSSLCGDPYWIASPEVACVGDEGAAYYVPVHASGEIGDLPGNWGCYNTFGIIDERDYNIGVLAVVFM